LNVFRFKTKKERPESLEHRDSPNYYWNIGMAISALMMVLILVGYVWTPYSTTEMSGRDKFLSPCLRHPLGTDNFGRDLLSRIMEGAGSTFLIALCVILIGGIIGTIIGSLTGYFGGMADVVLMRICDAITAFPSILLALVLIAVIGMGKYQIILILGILFIPSFARVVRGEVAKQRTLNYVQAARLMGASHMRIIFLHILPNTIQVLLPILTIGFNNAVLSEASMSYLGIGVGPADASLGRMLSESQGILLTAPWCTIFPAVVVVLLILGVGMIGEGIRERMGDA
jgi:peptide/nickel transport system permease protein